MAGSPENVDTLSPAALPAVRGVVRFDRVGFKYNPGGQKVPVVQDAAATLVPPSSRRDAPERVSSGTHEATGTPFVAEGQDAVVRLDALNCLRYGTLKGRVVGLSADAVDATAAARSGAGAGAAGAASPPGQSPQAPPSYMARIALAPDTVMVDGRAVRPTPGMTATLDVRTGERRLIEFVLQPVFEVRGRGTAQEIGVIL